MTIWARLPGLLLDYYDKNILKRIRSKFGNMLKIDAKTINNGLGRFARVCIQVDLQALLVLKVKIGKHHIQCIQYIGVDFCFECDLLEHSTQSYKKGKEVVVTLEITKMNTRDDSSTIIDQEQTTQTPRNSVCGTWNVVAPKKRHHQRPTIGREEITRGKIGTMNIH